MRRKNLAFQICLASKLPAADTIRRVGVSENDMEISKKYIVKYWEEFSSISSRGSGMKSGL